jgi:hypothetical protein
MSPFNRFVRLLPPSLQWVSWPLLAEALRFPTFTGVGSEEARFRASLRPPPKLHVQISRMQLSRRLKTSEMSEKELTQLGSQAHARGRVPEVATASSRRCASVCSDATKYVG